MKQFKRFSYFLRFGNARMIFTFGLLMLFGFTSNGQCGCQGPTVGTGVGIPTLSQSTINTNQPFTGCVIVDGEFTIDDNWTVSSGEIIMEAGAEIFVAPIWDSSQQAAIEFAVINSEIHGCNQLWRSITLLSLSWGLGARFRLEGSIIRDGEHAINLPDNNVSLTVLDNTFDANFVSIFSPPKANLISLLPDAEVITGNTFESTYDLLPHYDPQQNVGSIPFAGVELHDVYGIKIGTENGNSGNVFNNLRHGVILERTNNCLVGGATITNLQEESIGVWTRFGEPFDSNIEQTGIRNCNMSNLQIGIRCEDNGSVTLNNVINANDHGIILENCNERRNLIWYNNIIAGNTGINATLVSSITDDHILHILGNEITGRVGVILNNVTSRAIVENNIPISIFNDESNGRGIEVSASVGEIRIQNNTINFEEFIAGSGAGINITNSEMLQVLDNQISAVGDNNIAAGIIVTSSPNNSFCCNSVDKSNLGVTFTNVCNNTQFNTTSFGAHTLGLFLVESVIGIQNNPGNDFANGNMVFDAFYSGATTSAFFIGMSRIFTNPSQMTDNLNFVQVPVGLQPEDWFTLNEEQDMMCAESPTCGLPLYSSATGTNGGEIIKSNDILISKFDGDLSMEDNLLKWDAQLYLYNKLQKHPDLINQNEDLNSFYNEADNGDLGKFYQIRNGIQSLNTPTTNQLIELENATGVASSLNLEIKSLKEEIQNGSGSEKMDLYITLNDKMTALNEEANTIKNIRVQIDQNRIARANSLLSLNKNLPTTNIYQENEKKVNQIYLETIGKGMFEFTSEQKVELENIAKQCVTVGGSGVLKARSIQQNYSLKFYDDINDLCGSSESFVVDNQYSFEDKTVKNKVFSIYPNPTNGSELTITFNEVLEEEHHYELYNINGALMIQNKIPIGAYSHVLDNLRLDNGIYFLKLHSSSGTIKTEKIVVSDF